MSENSSVVDENLKDDILFELGETRSTIVTEESLKDATFGDLDIAITRMKNWRDILEFGKNKTNITSLSALLMSNILHALIEEYESITKASENITFNTERKQFHINTRYGRISFLVRTSEQGISRIDYDVSGDFICSETTYRGVRYKKFGKFLNEDYTIRIKQGADLLNTIFGV